MDNQMDREQNPHSRNMIGGNVRGPVVQAHSIYGGVHVDQSRMVNQSIYFDRKKSTRPSNVFAGLVVMAGGGYAGLVVAGLVNVITGQVFAANKTWLTAIPALAFIGACGSLVFAIATRRRWLPHLRRRTLVLIGIGSITCPLAFAVPDEQHGQISAYFYLAGAVAFMGISIVRRLLRSGP